MAVHITLRTSCRQRWRLISRRMASGRSLTRSDSSTPRRAAHRWRSNLLTLWQTSRGSWRLAIHHSISRFRSCISSFLLTIDRRKTWDVCPIPHEIWHLAHFHSLRCRSKLDISQCLKGFLARKDDFDVATGVNYGVASSLSRSKFICCPEMGTMRIKGPPKTTAIFKDEHLERAWASQPASITPEVKPLGSHMVGWTIGDRVHRKSSASKVTHPSTIPA